MVFFQRYTVFAVHASLLLLVGGCSAIGFTMAAVFPEKVKAVYALEDRPTVVVVDDLSNFLHDRELMNQIAVSVGAALVEQEVLTTIVAPGALAKLEDRGGQDYRRMPIDAVGKEVGADQVVHINVESIVVTEVHMMLVCRVKVIDAVKSVRLFPQISGRGMAATARGVGLVTVKMVQQKVIDMNQRARTLTHLELARRIGIAVSRLFYTYEVPMQSEVFRNSPA